MKKLHTYTRILLSLLLLLVADVAWGQGQNEAIIPIQSINAWEQHKVDGHPINNLKDGEENTTWSSYRDGFPVLEYMHVKNPDASKNGRRHWVELPYIPNQNTEIEITFKAKTTSGGLKQNIFGFGYPPFGHGMSLNIADDGKFVFGTSNHTHTFNVQADNNKHTIVCSATSVKIDGGENLMPGTIDPNNSDPDVIQDGYTSQHNLCLFSNPAEDQQWARCFDGDIYSVKIRENGKLLYDLVPAKGWWGRPGFYDRVSTEVFTFFDMVDYVKNDVATNDDPALHIHYKIPYTMGTGTTVRTQWTDNLVTNGNFASEDTASYTFVKDIFVPRISSDQYGKYIQVYNNGTHAGGNVWDCHLTVKLTEELAAGQKYTLSFYGKASKAAVATFDFSNEAGDWHSGDGQITSSTKNIPFTTEWKLFTYTIEGREDTAKGLIKGIGLNFNNEKSAVLYQVSDFKLFKEGDETTNLAPYHNEYADLSGYPINDAVNDARWTSRITTNEEKKCVQVVNNGTGANSWDCQFRMNLSETLNEGDQYSISFNIKAKNAANISGQLQQAGGGFYAGFPVVQVGTTWQRVEWTGTVGAHDGSVKAIALLLNETKSNNTYYITDIVIKKGTPSTEMVPNTELEITYKNTRTDQDYSSSRYMFSYGTKEDNVLALGIKQDSYNYTSGGVTTEFGAVPNVKNQTITTTFRPTEFTRGSVYNVTDATTWNKPVNYLYLFGTHSTNDMYARSFIGEIYGAVIREGGQVKVELQPAWKNGVYGFYDRRTNTFYTKDEDDDNLCGKGANFRGVTGHDAQAPIDHAEGIPQVGSVYPYTLTIDLANPKVVKNFYMTTAADKIGNHTNNSPARWTLYGSSGTNQWTELYKYEQVVPKFSELQAGTTPETSVTPYKSASELESATTYYLYNVETGRFFESEGRQVSPEWGTRAYVQPNSAWKVKVTLKDGKYTIYDCNMTKEPGGSRWYELYVFDNTNVWTDYDGRSGTDFSRVWNITSIGNNQYEISSDEFIPNAKLGTSISSDIDSDKRLYLSTDAKNTTWAFVSEADYNTYQAAKNLTKGDPMLNGKQYKYAINAENAEYKQFRLVIDQMVANNNHISLAELTFTSYFDFEHYVGRVYDNMGTPPDNLAVGGSSGYQQAYKMKGAAPDDPRLNEGVTLQRTHEYEHEIYLLPGETVDLTPFSDFSSTDYRAYNYKEQYVRWYNYKTDLLSDRLAFDKRNGLTVSALDEGHFAWNLNNSGGRTREGSLAHYTAVADPVADANGVIDIIAIEAGGTFDWNEAVWDNTKNAYTVTEPTLLWRHTFVIKDAKRRSDEMFTTLAGNNTYIANHKIKLMCPAGTPFQYPLPSYEDKAVNATHPTNYFYKDAEGNYVPIYHYSIETSVKDENESGGWKRLGATSPNAKDVPVGNEDYVAWSYKDLEGYNRVFYIKNPQVGTYKIRINALNQNATAGVRDSRMGDIPLALMEYELEVLAPADGIMVNETELKTNTSLSHQIPANMDKAFGKPTTKVDFDEVLPSQTTDAGNGHSYLKWPWQWENSSYGFGYENRGDYNMYMVADHMSITPFHGRSDGAADATTYTNVYDRKYYDNGSDPNKKGYFFYANAASDPSRMSVLNIGKDFCPNTKVFVSAWVNEFQGKDLYAETANVIFSFRGVKTDGTETVLNSFVTGYVSGGWNTPTGYYPKTKGTDSAGKDIDVINHVNATTNPDNRGKWMHVYYTFKTGREAEGFDHYIITLENNCTSSEGADYAIDDIRCYVRKPKVDASQLKPVCNGEPTTDLKIYADFDQMMDVFAFNEEDGTNTLSYCFLDREKYESELKKAYDAGVANSTISSVTYPTLQDWREKVSKSDETFLAAYTNAFNAAHIKKSYGLGNDDYGQLTYHKRYTDNTEYVDVEGFTTYHQALRQDLGATRNLVFPCKATDAQMEVGKQYVIALIKEFDSGKSIPINFRLEDQCQASNDFEVVFSGEVKIDGKLMSQQNGLNFCSNQRPVVTIDLNGISEGGVPVKTDHAPFDWYYGPYKLTAEETEQGWTTAYSLEQKGSLLLSDAIGYFRYYYPSATETVFLDGTSVVPTGSLTQEMLDYINEMIVAKKIALYKESEAMSTTDLFSPSELEETAVQKKYYLTAIPINPDPSSDIKYCLQPIKVMINLNTRTPLMKDGDDQGLIPYPATMRDVPLRIGLKQLKSTVIENLDATSASRKLLLPLREITPSTSGVKLLIQKPEDDLVYLAASNDPNVLAGTSGAVDIEDSADPGYSSSYSVKSDLKVVGKLLNITADLDKHGVAFIPANESSNPGNICHLAFLKNFKFREGYWYTLKFHFEESYGSIPGDHSDVCPGDVIFTVKVVPEYQMWTGEYSRNWNDDRNWTRVSKADLLWDKGNKTAQFLTDNADYITDGGTNDNTFSYAPADFTKVIIPAGTKFTPYMYEMRDNPNLLEVNFTGAPSRTNYLKKTSADRTEFMGTRNKEIGLTTNLVKFDMASVERQDGHIACRTWYDHTCDQIHFNAGAEIMDQRYLYYNKAWCDIDVAPGTWQTVSSPLMNIVAGDLYLPTATARQETPLFEDITYQPSLNDRFKPAVYQRSWNKGAKATVYKLDQTSTNVGVNLDWSHVYNDVNVKYGAGQGFSIKVDVSAMPVANQPGQPGNPEKARFRFPKADKSYTYYSPENTDGDKKTEGVNSTDIIRDPITGEQVRPGKLSDLTSPFAQQVGDDTQVGTQYFLVGNPLMCYLDMNEFFSVNSTKYEPKYWVVTPDGQRGAVQDASTTSFTGTDPYLGILPPGVSFFVQLKQDPTTTGTAINTTPKFTADMMIYELGERRSDNDPQEPIIDEDANVENNDPVYVATNQGEGWDNPPNQRNAPKRQMRAVVTESSVLPQLRLTAESLNGRKSLALLTDGTMTQHTLLETLFDSNLKDDALLYTTKNGQAQTIANIAPGDTLPLAIAGARDEVKLRIEGAEDFSFDLFLIDSEEGTAEPLVGDVVLKQAANGVRYYIATHSKGDTDVEPSVNVPRVTAQDGYITVYAPANGVVETSAIYTTGGIRMDYAEHITDSHRVQLRPGIYIVKLLAEGRTYTYKLMLSE